MEKINELLGNNEQGFQKDPDFRKDCWKTTFRGGVCGEKISKENIETFLSLKCTTWSYDYAFATPSGSFIFAYILLRRMKASGLTYPCKKFIHYEALTLFSIAL